MKGKHKQRIVGGIVLIAIAVILYPFLFTREDVDNSPALTISEPPGAPAIPLYVENIDAPLAEIADIGDGSILRTAPLQGGEISQVMRADESVVVKDTDPDADLVQPALVESADTPEPATVVPRDVITVVAGSSAATIQPGKPVQGSPSTPSSTPTTGADGLPEGWTLQLAALSSEENTSAMVEKLRAAGHQAYMRKTVAGAKTLFRVYIGPDLDRQKLEELRPAIDKAYGVNSLTVRFLP